jgi:sugar transferase (PEP-CTERM/EpsH1 system associated)
MIRRGPQLTQRSSAPALTDSACPGPSEVRGRMRVLWIKSHTLLPLDTGGKLRTWHLLRHLAERHDITYVGCATPDQRSEHVQGMREVARAIHVIPGSSPPKGSLRFYADAALHLLDPLPYAVAKYRSRAFARRIEAILREQTFDVIVCDFVTPAVNVPRRLPCPAVVFTHNVEAEIWRRHAATQTGRLQRVLYGIQHRRMLRFERRTLERFDGVLAVSAADRDTFGRLYPEAVGEPAHVVPTGVDTRFFAPTARAAASRSLVFTGSMDWLPNEDAMVFFCREVLPLIRREEPDVTLSIVGRAPTPTVARLAQQAGIVVTGRVDDVRPYMAEAAVYIVPLRVGGGTRLKIFEAMSMAKAVVSTTVGAEGLPVTDGAHLLLADDPASFAAAVLRLLRDTDERHRLGVSARALVERYDWAEVATSLEEALLRYARRGGDRTAFNRGMVELHAT